MNIRLIFAACALVVLTTSACRKRNRDASTQSTESSATASTKPPAPPEPPKDVPPETALHFLNDAVRNYYAEKLRMPASFEEVYAAGYLKERYNPPPGRRFVINQESRAVELR